MHQERHSFTQQDSFMELVREGKARLDYPMINSLSCFLFARNTTSVKYRRFDGMASTHYVRCRVVTYEG